MDSPKIDATYGCALIGLVCGAILYGVTLLQTFFYYKQYPKDTFLTKFLVRKIKLTFELTVLCGASGRSRYLVTNYANPAALGKTTW
ncbi:hypothetical protein AMATHDRAFT_136014 [Amanita thiersii Skay4041]|uniref:Uncharacterized protein n=1 Tax=Amanita thiersii Skay4041 TaxID=703135 RepID=A0A2A9P0G3_9AGAR|nr:hypothetical protein AMATHDRAFT_136014 [Amanita thiersii Skay4041]